MKYDPNRKPFPRSRLIEPFSEKRRVHPLFRESMEGYFRGKNPAGYHHDLGVADVFLDNFGMLFEEQFESDMLCHQYADEVLRFCLEKWDQIKNQAVHQPPFWGEYMNSARRQANSGEPRGILRLMVEDDWTAEWEEVNAQPECIGPPTVRPQGTYSDWRHEDLFPWRYSQGGKAPSTEPRASQIIPGGVILPKDWPGIVDRFRILHPRESTPDLPLRVGRTKEDAEDFQAILRDQGSLGACSAHAVCMALDLLARRNGYMSQVRFSPAWLHCMTGERGDEGRRLRDAIDVITKRLPCLDEEFPYNPEELRKWVSSGSRWESASILESSKSLTQKLGPIRSVKLRPDDISTIKAYLAAGWLVLVSSSLTYEMIGDGFQKYGMPLTPLKGQKRLKEGHAWLLVGYEHSDGNLQWKYQGRFLALNSWGDGFPELPALGRGICALPFAVLLTEGIEAYAIRFRA